MALFRTFIEPISRSSFRSSKMIPTFSTQDRKSFISPWRKTVITRSENGSKPILRWKIWYFASYHRFYRDFILEYYRYEKQVFQAINLSPNLYFLRCFSVNSIGIFYCAVFYIHWVWRQRTSQNVENVILVDFSY